MRGFVHYLREKSIIIEVKALNFVQIAFKSLVFQLFDRHFVLFLINY